MISMPHYGRVDSTSFSPMEMGVEYNNTKIQIWEAATGIEVAHMQSNRLVYAAVFSPDGQWVVSRGKDYTARVWEAATGTEIARVQHESWVNTVAFSPNSQWVVSGSTDGMVRVWKATTGTEIAHIQHDYSVRKAASAPTGSGWSA